MRSSVFVLFFILSGGTSILYKISNNLLFMPILTSLAQIIIPMTEHKFKFRNNFLNSKP